MPNAIQNGSGERLQRSSLRRGFSTGANAAAAAKAALLTLLERESPDTVSIRLPRGEVVAFSVFRAGSLKVGAYAVVRKDAGDDPDVTHRALIIVSVLARQETQTSPSSSSAEEKRSKPSRVSVSFEAGSGVGTVTLAGLPLAVGEPAINPVPRQMITEALEAALEEAKGRSESRTKGETKGESDSLARSFVVRVGVAGGRRLAEHTWNGRLGILGGLSILGTTGIVEPYSCSAWIHAIHRGIDVARAAGFPVVAAATGRTSEGVLREALGLGERAVIDMGDFAAGMLKYMRKHPVSCLVIGGGVGKMVKLSQGQGDLHSGRSSVDFVALAGVARDCGAREELVEQIGSAISVGGVLALLEGEEEMRGRLFGAVAEGVRGVVRGLLLPSYFPVGVLLVERSGGIVAHLEAE